MTYPLRFRPSHQQENVTPHRHVRVNVTHPGAAKGQTPPGGSRRASFAGSGREIPVVAGDAEVVQAILPHRTVAVVVNDPRFVALVTRARNDHADVALSSGQTPGDDVTRTIVAAVRA